MGDRIDELVQQVMDVFAHSQNPETDEWELSGDHDQYPSYVALNELATIAREEWKKPRSCPSCGEYMVHIDTAEIVQQETAEYVARALKAEAMCERLATSVAVGNWHMLVVMGHTPDDGYIEGSAKMELAAASEAVSK